MTFGIFKKLKDGFKKGIRWLKNTIEKIKPITKTILNEAPKIIKNEKVKNYFDTAKDIYEVSSDGINALDEAVNNNNYNQITDWTKANIVPRLKHY